MSHQHTAEQLRRYLADTLLIQTSPAHWQQALDCSNRPGGGLVFTGHRPMLEAAAHVLRRDTYTGPVLVDRARYTGANRTFAKHPFDPAWMRRQAELPLAAVLTDSGYVEAGDVDGLHRILSQAGDWGTRLDRDVVAVLPLHRDWLATDKGLPALVDEVTHAGVPIAVAFEHTDDPLSARSAIDGLVTLLAVPAPIIVLRCDIAALGALAFGAVAAAVGTTTGLRHLYPLPADRGGFGRAAQTAAILRPCLAYYSLPKILQVIQGDPDNPLWVCNCEECGGRRLDRLQASPDPDTAAFLHSLHTLYGIRTDIIGRTTTTLTQRQRSWAEQCSHASAVHDEIRQTIPGWKRPTALKHWTQVVTPATRAPDPGPGSPDRPVPPPRG